MRIKEFIKNKKVVGITIILLIIVILVGIKVGKGSANVNTEKLNGLIETNYEANITSEEDKTVDLNIVGKLNEEESLKLINSLFNIGSKWDKEEVTVNFFDSKDTVKKVDKFYVEGLLKQVIFDYKTDTSKVGIFEVVSDIGKSKIIAGYNKGEVCYNDGCITIKFDMDVKEDARDVVEQSKAFIEMFKNANKDKDFSSVQLDINHDQNNKAYSYNTDFEKIVKVITITKH